MAAPTEAVTPEPVVTKDATPEPKGRKTAPRKYGRADLPKIISEGGLPADIIDMKESAKIADTVFQTVAKAVADGRLPKPIARYVIRSSYPQTTVIGWNRAEMLEALKTFKPQRRGGRAAMLRRREAAKK